MFIQIVRNKTTIFLIAFIVVFTSNLNAQNEIYKNYFVEELVVSGRKFNKTVYCLLEDSRGFLWIGTTDGLYRYNGITINKYTTDRASKNSLLSNQIMKIVEDENGDLYIATIGGGLSKFIWAENRFINYVADNTNPNSIASNDINTIAFDHEMKLWIGFRNGHLDLFDPKNETFTNYGKEKTFEAVIDISEIEVDHNNVLWIGTWRNGLFRLEITTEGYDLKHIKYDTTAISKSPITSLFADNDGKIWFGNRKTEIRSIGLNINEISELNNRLVKDNEIHINDIIKTDQTLLAITNSGLYYLENTQLKPFFFQTGKLSSNLLICAIKDSYGNIWIGTNKGIIKLRKKKFNFVPLNISGNYLDITAIASSDKNEIFAGTWGQGVYKLGKQGDSYHIDSNQLKIKDANFLMDINDIDYFNGTLHIGTQKNGLFIKSDEIIKPKGLIEQTITTIHRIDSNLVFLGTNNGLFLIDSSGNILRYYESITGQQNTLSDNKITSINQSEPKVFWIGTIMGGLNRAILDFENYNLSITQFKNDYNNYRSLSSNYVTTIYTDKENKIWIGTENGGINKLIESKINGKDSLYFLFYKESDGLYDNKVLSINEDKKGNLWISGKASISKFNPKKRSFVNYTNFDVNSFAHFGSQNSTLVNSDGLFIYGGLGGVISFFPDSIQHVSAPQVFIKDLIIQTRNGETIKIDNTHKITNYKPLWSSDKITLPRDLKACSFEYIGLDLYSPEQVTYAYRLQGLEEEWNIVGNEARFVKYTNLKPGNYIFEVKAYNSDGIESITPRQIRLKVMTPIWKTWWAIAIYSSIIIFLYQLVRRIIYIKANLENEIKIERIRRENENELNQLKINFFTDISHELRTPLTLVVGPLENLAQKLRGNKDLNDDLKIIDRNAKRLTRLIEQVMDIRKIDKGHLEHKPEKQDIVQLTREILNSFKAMAEFKNIAFRFLTENKKLNTLVDKDKFEKVVTNLVSNAFKYTPSGENILVELFFNKPNSEIINLFDQELYKENSLKIAVINTGNPIPLDLKHKLFERFYRGENIINAEAGIGLGLSIAKDLAEVQGGKILIESDTKTGNCFLFFLPLSFKPESNPTIETTINKSDFSESLKIKTNDGDNIDLQFEEKDKPKTDVNQNEKVILLIEDDFDMLNFIESILTNDYKIIKASDGNKGLKYALDEIPHLIICDIMLPGMNGIEICEKVKKDIRTSHIPVVILSAKVEVQEQIEGIETGADAYITKPFDNQYLKTRVAKLIEQREIMIQRFSKELTLNTEHVSKGKIDKEFMNNLVQKILENLNNTELKIEDLSTELKMSRIHLYRKIKDITGSSPSEFIRSVRLKHAAQKILKGNLNIVEIAYTTGFNSPNYFTTCFKKQFGVTPKEFARNNKID